MKKSPKEVYFQKLLYNDYKVNAESEFKVLTDALKLTPNTFRLHSFGEMRMILDGLAKGGKVLILVEDKMLKEYREYL